MSTHRFIIFFTLLAAVHGLVIRAGNCPGDTHENCRVTQVRIDPCQNPSKACIFEKGINASLSFDFTPNFASANLKTGVFYQGTAFSDMESDDACGLTTCPSVPGTSQTLNYNLYIGQKLPNGIYPIVWKVWNGDDAKQECCFTASIRLKNASNVK